MGGFGTADVVIVGAGVNGAATAFYLARRGIRNVVVLDSAYPGAGATSRGMGLLRTYHANEPEAALAIASLRVFRNWAEEVGGTCGYRNTGFLWIDRESNRATVAANAALVTARGGKAELLDGDALRRLQPHLCTEGVIAAYEPECGYAYGALACDAYLAAASALGVRVQTYTRALALKTEGDAVAAVVTEQGEIATRAVVLAAGAWSGPLLQSIGIRLPITPRRLSIGRIFLPPTVADPMTFLDAVVDTSFKPDGDSCALISMRDSRHGAPLDPDRRMDDVEVDAVRTGIAKLARRIPTITDAIGARVWTGVDGFTPDHKGIYGKLEACPGLVVCAGASEKGFKVAPAVGMGLAELIATGQSPLIEDPVFSPARFSVAAAAQAERSMAVSELI